ncbi:MAG: hypothetical protein F4040_02825, partial [Synechococcus sp. SB0670_bin_20]|nr:hypothetical protein [Synechococcus sp. SB0670_bin_20]
LTPLHAAAETSETPAVVQALLDAGADLNARDKDGKTPLDQAKQHNQTLTVLQVLQGQQQRRAPIIFEFLKRSRRLLRKALR